MDLKRILILLLLLLAGCDEVELPYYPPKLVVEGWIEAGGPPVVSITTTVPVSREPKSIASLEENIVRWATVSVSDGEREVFLTGRLKTGYFPPYIYTTSMLSGEVGKKYTLKVQYSGQTLEAETVVPAPVPLEYVTTEKLKEGNYILKAGVTDDAATKDYYKFFVKVARKDSLYKPSFMGLMDDEVMTSQTTEVQVFNGYNPSSLSTDVQMHFQEGDRVFVRFCTLCESSYQYWSDYDDVSSLALNPFFPVTKKIRSNIKGGLGYWAGYGTSYYQIECR
jgi:hypothetical protein